MPVILLGVLLIVLQVAFTALVYLGLRYELTRRQQRELHRSRTKVSRLNAYTEREIKFILGEVKELQTITAAQLKEINDRADKVLHLANDMSRRFDVGEKPKPTVNSMSTEARRDAREEAFIRKNFDDNSRGAVQ